LREECAARLSLDGRVMGRACVGFPDLEAVPNPLKTIFARQVLPRAIRFSGHDTAAVAKALTARVDVLVRRSNRQSGAWTLHAYAVDDDEGLARAKSVAKLLMAYVRSHQATFAKRYVSPAEFLATARGDEDLIMQIYVPSAEDLWFSLAGMKDGLLAHEAGFQRMKTLKGAPSRSASKLEEALAFMGEYPHSGQTAVDLGAAPGGWSFVLARHGARVWAVDHAGLEQKAFRGLKGQVEHVKANGLSFAPSAPVDWLVCDMVMAASSTLGVLRQWFERGWMRRFVVNVKLPKQHPWPQVQMVLELAETLKASGWQRVEVRQLLHDRSEVTIFGIK
jgi:23S rRNA C2498 (ribose-2'-O)-methylase RlmM